MISRGRFLSPPPTVSLTAPLGFGVLILALLHSWWLVTLPIGSWVGMSSEFHEALLLGGPWAGVVASWAGARSAGHRQLLCLPSSVRSGQPIVIRHLAVMCVVASVAMIVGLAPALISTAVKATAGRPNIVAMLGGIAALCLFVSLGYLIGCMLPVLSATLVSVFGMFALVLVGAQVSGWSLAWAPVWSAGLPGMGQSESDLLALFRLVFFVVATLATAMAAVVWLRGRSLQGYAASAKGLAILVVPLGMVLLGMAKPVDAISYESSPQRTCETVDRVDLCLHRGHEALLSDVTDAAQDVLEAFGPGANAHVNEVADSALWEADSPNRIQLHLDLSSPESLRQAVMWDVAMALSSYHACLDMDSSSGMITPRSGFGVAEGFTRWLLTEAGMTGDPGVGMVGDGRIAFETLSVLDTDQVRNWVHVNDAQLRECRLQIADLPS